MAHADDVRLELMGQFRVTARERLQRVEAAWLALETAPDDTAPAPGLLRELHTLKGESKMMGFAVVSQVVHRAEELVVRARELGFRVPASVSDLLLAVIDATLALVDGDPEGAAPPAVVELLAAFDTAFAAVGAPAPTAASAPPPSLPGPPERLAVDRSGLRVDSELVHRLADHASEAVVAHAHLGRLWKRLIELTDTDAGRAEDVGPLRDRIRDELAHADASVRELEHLVRDLRLVPVGPLLQRHARAARDLGREQQKEVLLVVDGGDVTVDRDVVERVSEPLLHLIRNAVDHGLETQNDRRSAGKAEAGRIHLAARQTGREVVITVEDDGRGVDLDAVRARAVELGWMQTSEPCSDADAQAMLFAPGFSTRRQATETSGRGVGLDVVRRSVDSVGGSVSVSGARGTGTRFELRLPARASQTRAVVVSVGTARFAVPETSIVGAISLDGAELHSLHDRLAVAFEGEHVILADMSQVLGVQAGPRPAAMRAIVIGSGRRRVALTIDDWQGDVEIVIKPLGPLHSGERLVGGACVLDDGGLALVLSATELVDRALGESRAADEAPETQATARVLLVEDSAITRAMVARLLRLLRYEVREAEDGMLALRALETDRFDLILTDIDMPNLDGIGLLERLRADARWRRIPVVVLSTRGSVTDRERAVRAGADAYLIKTEFSEAALREVLSRQLGRA